MKDYCYGVRTCTFSFVHFIIIAFLLKYEYGNSCQMTRVKRTSGLSWDWIEDSCPTLQRSLIRKSIENHQMYSINADLKNTNWISISLLFILAVLGRCDKALLWIILISPHHPSLTVGVYTLRTRKERRICLDHFVLLFYAQGTKVNFVIGSMHTGLNI